MNSFNTLTNEETKEEHLSDGRPSVALFY